MDGHKLPYYRMSPAQALDDLRTGAEGLTQAEAADRLHHVGPNRLERAKHAPLWLLFGRQFKNLLVLLLLASAGISAYLHDIRTAVILLLIALINAVVGLVQEYRAESLLSSLEQLAVTRAKVLRGGRLHDMDSSELAPGDVIIVEAGDNIPADCRVLVEDELATNDFALTGESQPARKFKHAITGDVPIGARHNTLYMGTTVAIGSARALVVSTGMNTELGRIASLSQAAHTDSSPLQRELNHLGVRIAQGTLLLAAILTLIQLQSNIGLKSALLFGISIAAAMIPNGLAAEVNITLAQIASKMARKRALVKKLSAVETLGAATIIATDKTGTLTQNQMTVTRAIIGRTEYTVSGTGYELNGAVCSANGRPIGGQALKELQLFFEAGALASNAEVNPPDADNPVWHVVGDPTEGALITLARKAGLEPNALNNLFPERKEYAFDSARKRMTSVREVDGQLYAFVKGAPEAVMAASTSLWDHGHTRRFTAADRAYFAEYNERHAAAAERNLAFAYRVLPRGFDPLKQPLEDAEQKLTFLGMVSMVDPLRPDVPAAMQAAQDAHIRISIVTGDYPATAAAVARKANLSAGNITVVTGTELAALDDAQVLDLLARGGAVFSRVSPEDKLRIVEIAKAGARNVVAVTGDGINDAPALKRADIGVAMGRTGTDVAKQAAEIVLLDDSFATLMSAVEQGRLTFQNIKRAARCVLTDNMSELLTVLIGLAAFAIWGIPSAITAVQILAIDLVAEMLPITALGWDPAAGRLMHAQPRDTHNHLINRTTVAEFVGFGLLAAVLAYTNYLLFFPRHHISAINLGTGNGPYLAASILTFVTIVLCQFVNLLLVRSEGKLFSRQLWSNKKLLAAFAISIFCILNVVYNPVLQPWFGSASLTGWDWLTAATAAALYTSVRLFHRHTRRHSARRLIQKHGPVKVRATLPKFAA